MDKSFSTPEKGIFRSPLRSVPDTNDFSDIEDDISSVVPAPSPEQKSDSITRQSRKIRNEKVRDLWISNCCGKRTSVDSNLIRYSTQMGFALTILAFAMVQLSIGSENRELYISLLSGIIGIILPNPTLERS